MTAASVTRECAGDGCDVEFEASRADAVYCSGMCRQRAYRARQQAGRPARRRYPITDSWREACRELRRAAERVERLMADDRFIGRIDDLHAIGGYEIARAKGVVDIYWTAAIPMVSKPIQRSTRPAVTDAYTRDVRLAIRRSVTDDIASDGCRAVAS